MNFSPVNWGDNPHRDLRIALPHRTIPYGAGLIMTNSSASKEIRPRGRLPRVGSDGEPGAMTGFEISSPLSEAGTEMLEGAAQEILCGEESTDDGDQDHSVVASSYDVSQASEVGSVPQPENADSESSDSDVSNDFDQIFDELGHLRGLLAENERELESYKTLIRDQQLRIQDLEHENQDHGERIRSLRIQGYKLRCGLEDMVDKSKELHKKDKMNQNAQKREFASLTRIGEQALEELEADD